jgi:hypothetical protein
VVAWPRWSAEVAGGGREGGVVGSGKGLEVVEGVVEVEEALSLPSPWAEMAREGGSTEAGGGRLWSLAWQRCAAWERIGDGGGGCEGAGRRNRPIYRRGKALGRWPQRCSAGEGRGRL